MVLRRGATLLLFMNLSQKMQKLNMKPIMLRNFRGICTSQALMENEKDNKVVEQGVFERINDKNKNTYLDMIRIFTNRDNIYRRGHVDFIYSALKNMEEFGVHKDLEVYRALIDVLPKGKFVPRNMMQAEFMHYPRQQQCIIDLLQQMEDNCVMPDAEMQEQLINTFGRRGHPVRKFWRMMYWMPKFRYINPFPVPMNLSNDVLELARLAITRISSVDLQTEITEYQTKDIEDSIDDTWIISAQSPIQKKLLKKHNPKEPVYVEGPFKVWLREKQVNYFMLRANSKPLPMEEYDEDDVTKIEVPFINLKPPIHKHITERSSIHEQDDGTILALCATGTSSKDSLLSWIRHLERNGNAVLNDVPIVFTLRSAPKEITVSQSSDQSQVEEMKEY